MDKGKACTRAQWHTCKGGESHGSSPALQADRLGLPSTLASSVTLG